MSKNTLYNMIGFSDFTQNWKPEIAKKTKRTDVALDILKENKSKGNWQSDKNGMKCKTCETFVPKNSELICECDKKISETNITSFSNFLFEDFKLWHDENIVQLKEEYNEYCFNEDEPETFTDWAKRKYNHEKGFNTVISENFQEWYQENKNSDILYDEYRQYLLDADEGDEDVMSFKDWMKDKYRWMEEYDEVTETKKVKNELMQCPNCKRELKINSKYKFVKCKCGKKIKFSNTTGEYREMTIEANMPKYSMLGEEQEMKSNPLFGYAAVRDQEIKKIGAFTTYSKMKDPKTPKERPILNAGIYIETDTVRGHINRIEGSTVFVESLDEPMKIVEVKLKDAVKLPKEDKNKIAKFSGLDVLTEKK